MIPSISTMSKSTSSSSTLYLYGRSPSHSGYRLNAWSSVNPPELVLPEFAEQNIELTIKRNSTIKIFLIFPPLVNYSYGLIIYS